MTLEQDIMGKVFKSDVATGLLFGILGGAYSSIGWTHAFASAYKLSKNNSIVNPILSFKKNTLRLEKTKKFAISQTIGYAIGTTVSIGIIGYAYYKAQKEVPMILSIPVLNNGYFAFKTYYENKEKQKNDEGEYVRPDEMRKPYRSLMDIMNEEKRKTNVSASKN